MSAVKDAVEQLVAALKTVPGISSGSVHTDPAASGIRCPALVIGPPTLVWETGMVEPTEAQFPIWAVVDPGERAVEQLWELVPAVSAAIHEHTEGVVQQTATPFPFPNGTTDLPSYQLVAEVPLDAD